MNDIFYSDLVPKQQKKTFVCGILPVKVVDTLIVSSNEPTHFNVYELEVNSEKTIFETVREYYAGLGILVTTSPYIEVIPHKDSLVIAVKLSLVQDIEKDVNPNLILATYRKLADSRFKYLKPALKKFSK